MDTIFDRLTEYGDSGAYPFHMPGHKRQITPETAPFWKEYFKRDITEIDGFDNLHHAEGMLKEAMDRAASLYRSEHTYFLVNGSTAGVLTAILSAVARQGSLIMARNSHKSAYHGLLLGGIKGIYLTSDRDEETELDLGVAAERVIRAAKEHPEAEAVFLTSPTYEGFSLPLREIAGELHRMGKCLIVDAAHGAHFGMADFLPENAVTEGADIVIHSLHKTLPSPTQTALLHVNGDRVDIMKVERYLAVFQSSSPSYVLMAGMDQCMRIMAEQGEKLMADFYRRRERLSKELADLKNIRVIDAFSPLNINGKSYAPEPGKMILAPRRGTIAARELYDRLRSQYRLQPELAAKKYVLLFLTVMDTAEGYQRLAAALREIDGELEKEIDGIKTDDTDHAAEIHDAVGEKNVLPEAVYTIAEADALQGEWVSCADAAGRISKEFVMVYPPGQPFLTPGERITKEIIDELMEYWKSGCEILGIKAAGSETIPFCLLCVKNNG